MLTIFILIILWSFFQKKPVAKKHKQKKAKIKKAKKPQKKKK